MRKLIYIKEKQKTPDGIGGYTKTFVVIDRFYAQANELDLQKSLDLFGRHVKNGYVLTTHKNVNVDDFIVIDNLLYNILNKTTHIRKYSYILELLEDEG